jgi:hypothetical protein
MNHASSMGPPAPPKLLSTDQGGGVFARGEGLALVDHLFGDPVHGVGEGFGVLGIPVGQRSSIQIRKAPTKRWNISTPSWVKR